MTNAEKREQLIQRIEALMKANGGIAKTAQLYELSMDYRKIQSLVNEGVLQRVKSGYYSMNFSEMAEEDIIAGLFPDGVLCMDSALFQYGYISERPFVWHIAVDKNTSKSRFKMKYPMVQPYYAEKSVIEMGVTQTKLGNSDMQIYDKDRLICDCIRFESQMDHEVLKQALRAYIQDEEKNIEHLMDYANKRKVINKVRNMIGVWL